MSYGIYLFLNVMMLIMHILQVSGHKLWLYSPDRVILIIGELGCFICMIDKFFISFFPKTVG